MLYGLSWGVRKESKTKLEINWIYTWRFIQIRKETLASLVKILNDNFWVKVSEKTINRILQAHDIEWAKPIFRPKIDKRIQKSKIEFCKYYLCIVDNARYVNTDESNFYTKNPYSKKWVFPGLEFLWIAKQIWESKNKCTVFDAVQSSLFV